MTLGLLIATNGCRCRGEKVGDKRAVACAEVPSKDSHVETDLGSSKRLIRDGVRATIRGVAEETPIAVTSFEGGAADVAATASAIFVIGLGALARNDLASALTTLAKRAPVIAVMGPADDVDVARAAIADANVIDGSVVRAFAIAGLEVVTIPGSDDPASLPEHGRGCLVRAADVKALAGKLSKGRPRVALVYAAPSRDPARPVATDGLPDVAAWIVGGPLDRDPLGELTLPPGARAPMIPSPRALAARTTSSPGVVAPGYVLVRADGPNIVFKYE